AISFNEEMDITFREGRPVFRHNGAQFFSQRPAGLWNVQREGREPVSAVDHTGTRHPGVADDADEAAPFTLGELIVLVQYRRIAANADAELGRGRQVGERLLE